MQRKVTPYTDFLKALKPQKTLDILSPRPTFHKENNRPALDRQRVPKHIHQQKREANFRPKSFGRDTRRTLASVNHTENSIVSSRYNTQLESVHTQRQSCSKSKSKGHFDSENTFCREAEHRKSTEAKVIVFYVNEILLVLGEVSRINWARITYLDYLQLLRLMNMIQNNYEPGKADHVHKFWSIIVGKDSTINLINFAILFLGTMNIHVRSGTIIDLLESGSTIQVSESLKSKKSKETFRTDKSGFLLLTRSEVKEIHNSFKEFRTTRMFLGRIQKKADLNGQKIEQSSSYRFHPTISNKSIQLAKSRRQRDSHKTSLTEQLSQQLKSNPDQQCIQQIVSPRENQLGLRRSQILYNLGKSRSKEKRNRNQDEIQFLRHEKMYTFKPQLVEYKAKKSKVQKRQTANVSGETKILERFLKGRVQKQVKRKSLEVGNTCNSKSIQKLRKKITQQLYQKGLQLQSEFSHVTPPPRDIARTLARSPRQNQQPCIQLQPETGPVIKREEGQESRGPRRQIFNFQVYLQGGVFVEVIRVYEGDSVEVISKQFILKHKLKPEMEMKLIASIKYNLDNVKRCQEQQLEDIEQESVECSFDF